MPARAIKRQRTDPAALFALAYTAAASFVALLASAAGPSLFLPIGIAALPFAASRAQDLAFRTGAALLLLAFVAAAGQPTGLLFVPGVAALAYSAYRAALPRIRRRR